MTSSQSSLYAALLAAGAMSGSPAPAEAAQVETGFLNAVVRIGDASLPYVVYVPRDYSPDRKWPVILFLHGAGERGADGLKQSQVGIGTAIRMNPDRFPCLVVMPQCPTGKGWGAAVPGLTSDSPDTAELALAALDETVRRYNGDPDRLYLTGLSMGGYGTWDIGSRSPGRFAALLPICGGGKPAEMAPALKDLPIWVFHGADDRVVPVERSRGMVEALRAAGSTRLQYTEYAGVDHNSWDATYGDEKVIAWLLAQRKER